MLLASPNGIAMTTPEDILAHASQEIGLSSGGSTNLSSQKNIVMHAQDKASLFAVNKGINIYAAKEDIKLQAQDGMIEAIAKKVVEIISAEDWIRIKAAKGIAIESQGNGIYLDEKGITFKSHAGIYYHAAQHVFKGAMKVNTKLPELPKPGPYAVNFLFSSLAGTGMENAKIEMYEPDSKKIIWKGKTNSQGISELSINDESKDYEALIGFDHWSSIFEDEENFDTEDDEIEIGTHGAQNELESSEE